jgi:hypothetical protein
VAVVERIIVTSSESGMRPRSHSPGRDPQRGRSARRVSTTGEL